MAEIDKINLNSTVYGLKDNVSRAVTGIVPVTDWTTGKYIATSGTTVSPTTEQSNSNAAYAKVSCNPGDKFTISGTGFSSGRLWAFIDSSNNKLSMSGDTVTLTQVMLTAPASAAMLIVNVDTRNTYALYKGAFLQQVGTDFYNLAKGYPTLHPASDTSTARQADILAMLTTYGVCYLAPGTYTITSALNIPDNARLYGAGRATKVVFAGTSTGQMINCGSGTQISNIWFDGGKGTTPTGASTNRHGIRVQQANSTDRKALQMSDCWITGFEGSGVRFANNGFQSMESLEIVNCRFSYNGMGIQSLVKGEYATIANCGFIDNYIGLRIDGGNNIVTGCTVERNAYGAVVNGSDVDNHGHGAFIGCSFNHNTQRGLEIMNITTGYLVSGCQFFLNTNYEIATNSPAVNVTGCQFGKSSHLLFSGDAIAMFSDNFFLASPTLTYTNNATTFSYHNIHGEYGTQIDILRPGERSDLGDFPAMLTIIDDDAHSRFYTDLLPLVGSLKVPISCAVPVSTVGTANHMTWAQLADCYENGVEILSHSYAHDTSYTDETVQDIDTDYRKAKNILTEKGFVGGQHLVFSGTTGEYANAKTAATQVYDVGLASSGNLINHLRTIDKYKVRRFRIQTDDYDYDVDALKDLIDTCKSSGGWMVWMMHTSDSETWGDTAKANLTTAIQYAITQGLPIVTVDHVVSTYLNKL